MQLHFFSSVFFTKVIVIKEPASEELHLHFPFPLFGLVAYSFNSGLIRVICGKIQIFTLFLRFQTDQDETRTICGCPDCVAYHKFHHGGVYRFLKLFSQPTGGRYFCQCVFVILPDEHRWMCLQNICVYVTGQGCEVSGGLAGRQVTAAPTAQTAVKWRQHRLRVVLT